MIGSVEERIIAFGTKIAPEWREGVNVAKWRTISNPDTITASTSPLFARTAPTALANGQVIALNR